MAALIVAIIFLGPIGLAFWYKLQKEKLRLKAHNQTYQLQQALQQLQQTLQAQNQQIQNLQKRIQTLEAIAVTPKWEEALRDLPLELTESEKAQILADIIKAKQLS
ncbi:MAG: hypothetical protein ACUVRD_07310 [Bacteroidia bacterium]